MTMSTLSEMKTQNKAITATEAVAKAVKLSRVDVVPIYPITPQTAITEYIAEYIANEDLDLEYIHAESEHSAMSIAIGASAVGSRAFTATSSQGLLYMDEMVHWAAGARLPIVMAYVNRAIAPPWNIQTDHQDSISIRDSGWVQFYVESNQEAIDTVIQAFKIAEAVNLPVMVCLDGIILSHIVEPVQIPTQEKVDEFLPNPKRNGFVDNYNPGHVWGAQYGEFYMQNKQMLDQAMSSSREVILNTSKDFSNLFGRDHGDLLDLYKCKEADEIILTLGSAVSPARYIIDQLREEGRDIGLAKLRVLRPFPVNQIKEVCSEVAKVTVIERDASYGLGGVLANELKAALYELQNPPEIHGYIAGRGGQDITTQDLRNMLDRRNKQEKWYIK